MYTLIPVFTYPALKNGTGTYPALKNRTGTYPAVKNGLLRKILSRVGHKKDICTPHMQNYMNSSIPHKSEMI